MEDFVTGLGPNTRQTTSVPSYSKCKPDAMIFLTCSGSSGYVEPVLEHEPDFARSRMHFWRITPLDSGLRKSAPQHTSVQCSP